MSGWVVPGQTRSTGIPLPPGLQIAATGSRVGAWLLDRVFFCFLAVTLAAIAVLVGAIDISPAAGDQIAAGRSANLVTVPLLTVNSTLLVVFGTLWVAIQWAYEAVSWTVARGTPGQRILSLRVADAATGRNLPIWRSTLRWLVLESVPQVALAVFIVLFVRMMGDIPPTVYSAGGASGSQPTNGTYATVSLAGDLAFLLSFGWRLALLVITTTHPAKRGLHDRVAGSLVVGRASAASYWAQSAYGGPGVAGAPYAPDPGSGPGSSFVAPPQSQWSGPPGFGQSPQGPTPGAWSPPDGPVASPTGIGSGQHHEEPDLGAASGLGRQPDPIRTFRRSPDPGLRRLADGTELPVGLRVPTIPRRLGAYAIDCGIVYSFYSVWLGVFGYGTHQIAGTSAVDEKQAILAGVIAGVGQLIYFVACWRLFRGTIGQRVLGLQIGHVQTGSALGWGDAFVRWCILQGPFALVTVVPVVLWSTLLFGAAGWSAFLMYDAYNKSDHRALHDRVVHSLVAQTSR